MEMALGKGEQEQRRAKRMTRKEKKGRSRLPRRNSLARLKRNKRKVVERKNWTASAGNNEKN